MTSYQEEKEKILEDLVLRVAMTKDHTQHTALKLEASHAIDELVRKWVIGEDDDMTLKINPASDEDLVISLGENANNRLRASQRQVMEKEENDESKGDR